MIKRFFIILFLLIPTIVFAEETITIEFSASASQSNVPSYLKMIETANSIQNKYKFVLEFKPGVNGLLAIRAMDNDPTNRLATTSPGFIEHVKTKAINEEDYIPVVTQGDACWAVITNIGSTKQGVSSLRGYKEITLGTVGYGSAAHLTALILAEQYKFKVRPIIYKANYDALVQMAGGQPINMVIERIHNYKNLKDINPNLQVLGITCNRRNPAMPEIPTVAEQGLVVPSIFLWTIANTQMPQIKRLEIAEILDKAQAKIGEQYLLESSDMYPPMFDNPPMSTANFIKKRLNQFRFLSKKYEREIELAR